MKASLSPARILILIFIFSFTVQTVRADTGDDMLDETEASAEALLPVFTPQKFVPPAPYAAAAKGRWSVLFPTFVMHGMLPANGANENMPRKIDPNGRFVVTPGIGGEWEGAKSLDIIAAFLKDCYDDYAGTFQIGQYFRLSKSTRLGYTLGVYVRQTPIACYTQSQSGVSGASARPMLGGHNNNGGLLGGQPQTNTLSTTTCLFEDNLPIRYTFKMGGGYVDIIPTPFLTFSTRLSDGPVQVLFKILTNYYLTEFGIALAF